MDAHDSQLDVPPIIDRIDDPEQLLAQIIECLQFQDSRGLKTYILEHKLKQDPILWELVLKIGEQVTSKTSEENGEFFDVCNRCLLYLVKVGKPKEMLLAILEQMDTFIDDVKYTCFLPLVQLVLLKIPTKLFHSLDIAMETVTAHVRSLPVPEYGALEGEERRLCHIDKAVVRVVEIFQSFLDFVEPFIKSVTCGNNVIVESKKSEALVLKKHLLRLFDFPLLHLVLTHDSDKPETASRLCVEKAMTMLSVLETDFHRLLTNCKTNRVNSEVEKVLNEDSEEVSDKEEQKEECDNNENEKRQKEKEERHKQKAKENDFVECWDFKLEVSEEAQACMAYILHAEHLGMDKYPQIYTKEYLLDFHLGHVCFLLKSRVYPINEKGLLLLQALMRSLGSGSLSVYYLDNPQFMAAVNDLILTMVKCPVKDHRSLALSVFTALITRFEAAGRYSIYSNLFSTSSHSGIKGYLITLLKDDISVSLKLLKSETSQTNEICNQETSKHFSGVSLKKILTLATALPERETSDMLENSDQIISAFNLLRFIVLADPFTQNISGFWNYLPALEKEFLSPLRKGLDLSEAHYNLERQNVMEGKDSGSGSMDVDVAVSGASLPAMEKKEKLQLISKAVNTHQLMKSLHSRLTELIDRSKQGCS